MNLKKNLDWILLQKVKKQGPVFWNDIATYVFIQLIPSFGYYTVSIQEWAKSVNGKVRNC